MKHLHFEEISDTEKEEIKKVLEDSQEYSEGKIPLAYQYMFPDGKTFQALQDENGFGRLLVVKKEKIIFDFSKLVPSDVKFVTPTYFEKHPDDTAGNDWFREHGGWGAHLLWKKIFCGELKDPRQILNILHEAGHINNNNEEEFRVRKHLVHSAASNAGELQNFIAVDKKLAKLTSIMERKAWAWALTAAKKISRETGVDFCHLFSNFQDIKNYIRDCLRPYRSSREWIIRGGFDENFYKEMEKLFDRWKYVPGAEEQKT